MQQREFKFGDEALQLLAKGVKTLAAAVKVTLGPSGRNVLINRPGQEPHSTKDGVTVANEVHLSDEFEDMGAQLVKSVAAKTAKEAGDGTTTATILAETILTEGIQHIQDGLNVVKVKRYLDQYCRKLEQQIARKAKKCHTLKSMKNVATVSANSDKIIGHMIAETVHKVGASGVVTVEESSNLKDVVDFVEGYQFPNGYITPYFVTDKSKMQCVLHNPAILLVDEKVEYIRDLIKIVEQVVDLGRPIVVIAEDVDGDALTTLAVNHANGKIGACAIRAPGMGTNRTLLLEDIQAVVGGEIISKATAKAVKNAQLSWLGSANKIIVTASDTTIIHDDYNTDAIQQRLSALQEEMGLEDRPEFKDFLKKRADTLASKIAVVRVGGQSEVEMRERRDRIDDALFATQAAVKEGILPGGGVALLRLASTVEPADDSKEAEVAASILQTALTAPICQIAKNCGLAPDAVLAKVKSTDEFEYGYHAGIPGYGNLVKLGVLDPARVIRLALSNAVSVAGTILTSQCVISEPSEDRDKRLKRIQTLQAMSDEMGG